MSILAGVRHRFDVTSDAPWESARSHNPCGLRDHWDAPCRAPIGRSSECRWLRRRVGASMSAQEALVVFAVSHDGRGRRVQDDAVTTCVPYEVRCSFEFTPLSSRVASKSSEYRCNRSTRTSRLASRSARSRAFWMTADGSELTSVESAARRFPLVSLFDREAMMAHLSDFVVLHRRSDECDALSADDAPTGPGRADATS